MRRKKWLYQTLAFALLLRLAALLLSIQSGLLREYIAGRDAEGYLQLAQSLLSNRTFAFTYGGPTAFRMPGYPVFIAVVQAAWHSTFAVQTIQILADLVSIYLIYEITKSVSRGSLAAGIACLAIAINPLSIIAAVSVYPETLSLLTTTAGTFFVLKARTDPRADLYAAISFAAGMYLKPSLAMVALVVLSAHALFNLAPKSPEKPTILSAIRPHLILAIALLPWIARNYSTMQAFIPLTTSSGTNLYGGNNPLADGGYASPEPYVLRGMSEVESSRQLTERAGEWIRSNPIQFLSLLPRKAGRILSPLALGTAGAIRVPILANTLLNLMLSGVYLWVLVGAAVLLRRRQFREVVVLSAVPLVLIAMSLITFGATRFFIPAYASLTVLGSHGLAASLNALGVGKDSTLLPGSRHTRFERDGFS